MTEKYYVIRPIGAEQEIYLKVTAKDNARNSNPDISEVVFADGTNATVLIGTKSGFEDVKRRSEQR